MNDNKQELLPCPFCGGEAEYSWEEAGMCSPDQPDLVTMYCVNDNCGAVIHSSGKEPHEAIEAWNTRTNKDLIIELKQARKVVEESIINLELSESPFYKGIKDLKDYRESYNNHKDK